MKCIWCNKGTGSNHTKNKDNILYYYICKDCVGFYIKEQDQHAKKLLEEASIKNKPEIILTKRKVKNNYEI